MQRSDNELANQRLVKNAGRSGHKVNVREQATEHREEGNIISALVEKGIRNRNQLTSLILRTTRERTRLSKMYDVELRFNKVVNSVEDVVAGYIGGFV